jgi:putative DNA primase/helicase
VSDLNEGHDPAAAEAERGPDAVDDAVELDRLAQLSTIEYERERVEAARRLGMRASVLDRVVETMRPKPEAATGRGLSMPRVEPWPEPVPTAGLLDALARTIGRHVVLPEPARIAVAGWIAHTWVYHRFQHTPRLAISSPVKRCGKSTLLDLLNAMSARPLKADNVSAASVFRVVEALRESGGVTLLVDEADSFVRNNEELRGVLNSGHEKSGQVVRTVEVKDGWQPVAFSTFCPVALAGIGTLPDTLADRSIPIELRRKTTAETVDKLRAPGARDVLARAVRCLARWAADHGRDLPLDPDIPPAMGDREGDISVPLLAIADHAGGVWPQRMREALLRLFEARNAAEGNAEAGTLLLGDIRTIFAVAGSGAERLASEVIVGELVKLEARPWPEWRQGRPMTAPQLARALKPFGVAPKQYRPAGGGNPVRGYVRADFEEAWGRYLPPDPPQKPSGGDFTRYSVTNGG